MARSSLSDVQGSIIDPAQTWNFDLFFEKLPAGLGGDTSMLTIRCQSATLPGAEMEPIEVALHGVTLRYRGRRTYSGSFTVQFAENIDWTTYQLFRDWHNLMLSWETNTGQSAAVYKIPATLTCYDDAGNEVKSFQITGVWPQTVPDVQFNGGESGYVQPEITFAFDTVAES